MKGLTKIIIDIGPLAIFFIFYTRGEEGEKLQSAILPLMIATIVAILFSYILEKKVPIMPTFGAFIILLFGGLTIYFNNEIFFKMKPTIINIIFAVILYAGEVIKKPLLKLLLGSALKLSGEGWSILTKRWVAFFIALGILNEIIWRTQSTDIWVNFKVFGILPITFLFTLSQFSLLKKHQIED
ncbi:septation protein A [Alphaproteobacteria bacterium]|nr:septation protein A [Alphaproteobacteria bacterium]